MKKYSAVALIVCRDEILFQKMQDKESGAQILDIFGISLQDGDDASACTQQKLQEIGVSDGTEVESLGSVLNRIHKPGVTVDLYISVFRVLVDEETKQELSVHADYVWLQRDNALKDPHASRINRLIDGVFANELFNHLWEEDQIKSWRDAGTLKWERVGSV